MSTPQPDLVITSVHNPRLKQLIGLRQRRQRRETGSMLIEGRQEVACALQSGHRLEFVYYCPELAGDLAWLAEPQRCGTMLVETSLAAFKRLAYRQHPDGVLAVAPLLSWDLNQIELRSGLVLIAEAVEKPGNLGTMLRTADAVGADAVICCDPATDFGNPNVIRASLGTMFARPVVEAEVDTVVDWCRRRGLQTVAATPAAAMVLWAAPLQPPVAVVVGSEHDGLSAAWLAAADLQVRIPMQGRADSLSVASATAMVLYEVLRQRGLDA